MPALTDVREPTRSNVLPFPGPASSRSTGPRPVDAVRRSTAAPVAVPTVTRRRVGTAPGLTDVREPARKVVGRSVVSRASSFALRASAGSKWEALKKARAQHKAEKRRERLLARARAGKLRAPRKWLYFPLISLAGILDALGIIAQIVNLTGVGAVVVSVISFLFGVFFFIVSVMIGRKIKGSRKMGEEFNARVARLERQAQLLRQGTAYAVRLVRRTAAGRSLLRKGYARKALVKGTKFISKFSKYLQLVGEVIPFLNLLPWFTINMVLLYRERKREFETTLAAVAEFPPADMDEEAAFDEFHQTHTALAVQTVREAEQVEQIELAEQSYQPAA